MCPDDVTWERSEAIEAAWIAIGRFIAKHRGGTPDELCDPKVGAFNVSFRMKFKDGGSAIIRFAKPGVNMFPEEKVRNEVAAIRYIHEHTTIPILFVLHWGTKDESPLSLGPFIIMDYIGHAKNLNAALNTPGFAREDRPILDPQIDAQKLEMLYGQVADILLELNKLSLPKIGSVAPIDDNGCWGVKYRPLTMNMNELVRVGTFRGQSCRSPAPRMRRHPPISIRWQISTSST
jgi:hypothetical protein